MKKTTKKTHTATNATNHKGEKPMKKTTKNAHAHASTNATSHEGETAMKTTNIHPSIAATNVNGETTMTDTQSKKAEAVAPTPTASAPATTTSQAGYLATCTALLNQLEAAFPQTAPLTAKDKKHMAKARKGSERYTPQLVALARQHGVSLASVPLDAIESASTEATQLVPLQKQIERMTTRVRTRMFAAQSTAWGGSSKVYSVLKRLSKDDGELATGLEPSSTSTTATRSSRRTTRRRRRGRRS